METMARRLRFQALGRACEQHDIFDLLLAHHGDDQAETVLSRIFGGYTGSGLQGIQAEAKIPECHGMHRVSESGFRRMLRVTSRPNSKKQAKSFVQDGGIRIHRPLLDFAKEDLIATCEERHVEWFEDATNADKTLTVRNAVRHLLQSNVLPLALNTESLRKLSQAKADHQKACEDAATAIFRACKIELETTTSIVSFSFPENIETWLRAESDPRFVAALLMRKILSISEDKSMLQMNELLAPVKYTFPFLFGDRSHRRVKLINVGRVMLSTHNDPKTKTKSSSSDQSISQKNFRIAPRPPKSTEDNSQVLIPASQEVNDSVTLYRLTTPILFYDRWWIHLRYRPSDLPANTSVVVRPMKEQDVVDIRSDFKDVTLFNKRLSFYAPGKTRFTIPAIVTRTESEGGEAREVVWALPSIGWRREGFKLWDGHHDEANPWRYTITYKKTDLEDCENHSVRQILLNW